jgi:hypothetical protein
MRRAIAADVQPKSRLARSQSGTSSTASPALTNSEIPLLSPPHFLVATLAHNSPAVDGGSTGRTHAAEKSPL